MDSPLFDRIGRELTERRRKSLLRTIPPARPVTTPEIDLTTNSYLALQTNDLVAAEAERLSARTLHGNLASRLVRESSDLAAQLETELAGWKKTEAALLFNSGYAANLGILQALCNRDTEVFCDRLNHASIIDGILLSGAKLRRYRHCDMVDLKEKLAASTAREKLIVTDAVFSMDGDCAPLADIAALAGQFGCAVMVDEAHAAGILGKSASGLVEATGVADAVDIRMGTLSKAVAGLGGFFAGSRQLRDYFVNFSRSLVYSTSLPHPVLAFDLAAVRHIRSNPQLGSELLEKSLSFRDRLNALGFDTLGSTTQIVPCLVPDDAEAVALAEFLKKRDIFAPAIRPPTVPAHTARIRFSVHLGFTVQQEETVIAALADWKSGHGR